MKYLLILISLIGLNAHGQKKIYDPVTETAGLYQFAELVNKGNSIYSISDVLVDQHFFKDAQPLASENHSIGFTSSNFWVRFSIKNTKNKPVTYYLETARPITDIAELYLVQNNQIKHYLSGDQIPFHKKQVAHRSTIFELELPPNSITPVYLHLKSDGETINVPLTLYTPAEFWMVNYSQQLFLGLFYGLLLLAGIIYLFFFSSLKKKAFLYYGFYVFSIGLLQAALDGMLFQYIFPSGGYFNSRVVLVTALLSNFFLLKYCEHFLNMKQALGNWKKLYSILYGVLVLLGAMIFINAKTLEFTYPLANINGLVSLLIILASLGVMRCKRFTIDPYFSVGIFFLVIGLLGFVMNNLSLLPNNFYTLNSAKFGAGMEVIFLSLSMTNLIKKLREEKERSQEDALAKSEEISQLKTYFMSNMSHELRTPINAILGIADQQLKQSIKNGNHQHFEMIRNASLSLLSNVNDILDFEKIQKNELQLNKEEFNPEPVIDQIYQNWKNQAQTKGIVFNKTMGNDIPASIVSDSERFAQIINHILSNAVKFTEKGEIGLTVTATANSKDQCTLSITVEDTGIGMEPEIQELAFSSFNQMRLNHKREFGGIGLGLSIVKHLTSLFGGTVSLSSHPGMGTKIYIELPMEVGEMSSINSTKVDDQLLYNLSSILVVEDNRMNQMVIKKLLSGLTDASVDLANNGQEGLETMQKKSYDMVLMDLQMPIMDGYEAINQIRSGKFGVGLVDVPIIVVTADATQETKQRVFDIGVNDIITKPVKVEQLQQKILQCMERSVLKIA